MALVRCPECGREISDKAEKCPACGLPQQYFVTNKIEKPEVKLPVKEVKPEVKTSVKEEKTEKSVKETGKSKKSIIIIGIIICLVVVAIVALSSVNKEVKEIEKLMKENKYQEALECLYVAEDFEEKHILITECMYHIAEEYYNNGEYLTALNMLQSKMLSDNANAIALRKNIEEDKTKLVTIMEQAYEKGYFSTVINFAENYFTFAEKTEYDVHGIYKQCRIWESMQGEYMYGGKNLIVDGFTYNENGTEYKLVESEEKDGKFYLDGDENHYIVAVEDGLIWQVKDGDIKNRKVWETTEHSEKRLAPYREPAIGMTAEQVRNGAWGEPEDINKTTYRWGTHEQWCYSGYRYIYLENGIVTAISE